MYGCRNDDRRKKSKTRGIVMRSGLIWVGTSYSGLDVRDSKPIGRGTRSYRMVVRLLKSASVVFKYDSYEDHSNASIETNLIQITPKISSNLLDSHAPYRCSVVPVPQPFEDISWARSCNTAVGSRSSPD